MVCVCVWEIPQECLWLQVMSWTVGSCSLSSDWLWSGCILRWRLLIGSCMRVVSETLFLLADEQAVSPNNQSKDSIRESLQTGYWDAAFSNGGPWLADQTAMFSDEELGLVVATKLEGHQTDRMMWTETLIRDLKKKQNTKKTTHINEYLVNSLKSLKQTKLLIKSWYDWIYYLYCLWMGSPLTFLYITSYQDSDWLKTEAMHHLIQLLLFLGL